MHTADTDNALENTQTLTPGK